MPRQNAPRILNPPRSAYKPIPKDPQPVRPHSPPPPSPADASVAPSCIAQKQSQTISEPRKLATVPSQVFFGLKCGASLYLPMDRPTKYAAVSPTQMITMAKSSNGGPCSGHPWSRTAYDKGKAIRTSPLALIPTAGSASTGGRLVHKVSSATPSTNKKKTSVTVGEIPKKKSISRGKVIRRGSPYFGSTPREPFHED